MSSTKYGVSIECDREASSRETIARNHVEASRGDVEVLVRNPREIKEEDTGTDSYGVCAINPLE
jgi:hypothetical protein